MTSHTGTPEHAKNIDRDIPSTDLFGLFAHRRRQRMLEYVAQRPGAVLIGDLAEYLAIAEGTPTTEAHQRISTDLYHSHLPRMAEVGVISCDLDAETVSLEVERRILTPYLELAQQS